METLFFFLNPTKFEQDRRYHFTSTTQQSKCVYEQKKNPLEINSMGTMLLPSCL